MDTIGNFIGNNSGAISSLMGTGAQLYGQQNAAEAIEKANAGAQTTQQNYLGTAGSYYQPYLGLGKGATTALGNALGTNGSAPNYSGFENMPGYQFAVRQGTQAIQRQAAAGGNAYTPNTLASVGQYVTGTAMQDYNTYISQLQNAAGIGATSANQLGNMTYNTGANISQLQSNTGQAEAGFYTGAGQTVGGALGAGNPYYGSGVAGGAGGVGSLVGNGIKALGGWLGSGNQGVDTYSNGNAYDNATGFSLQNGQFYDDQGNMIGGGETPSYYSDTGVSGDYYGGLS